MILEREEGAERAGGNIDVRERDIDQRPPLPGTEPTT